MFYGGGSLASEYATYVISYDEYLANPKKYTDTGGTTKGITNSGDGFCQSAYFQRSVLCQ